MQLEAYVVQITKLMEYVDSKEDPLIQTVRTHHHNINSAMLQTERRLKRKLGTGTRQRTAQQRTGEGKKDTLTVST
jgi:riboflavin synthase